MVLQYRLREGLAFCAFEDCAIILDVRADRYLRVGPRAAITLAWVAGTISTAVRPWQMERLARLGLIERAAVEPHRSYAHWLDLPHRSLTETGTDDSYWSFALALEVAWATLAARAAVRLRRFERLIATVGSKRARRSARSTKTGDLERLACAFDQHRRLVPLRTVCLADSLALLTFLARRGHFPHLVLGVAAHPFAAHCWVQSGGAVVNDALDHARLFKPILIV